MKQILRGNIVKGMHFNKSFVFAIAVLAFIALYCTSASAEYSGEWGTLLWTLDDAGEVIITGNGEMDNFKNSDFPGYMEGPDYRAWRRHRDKIKTVTINDGVTSIGEYAFQLCENIECINLPDSIQSIGAGAFSGTNITSIRLPDGITELNNDLFAGCQMLEEIAIPNSVTSIGNNVFFDCAKLKNINIPDSVSHIGHGAFQYCRSLQSVKIPDNVTAVYGWTFASCTLLRDVVLPDSLTVIDDAAFRETAIEGIQIPNKVTSIGKSAFYGCKNLYTITIPDSVTYLGESAFSECPKLLDVMISDKQTYLKYINDVLFCDEGKTLLWYPIRLTGNYYTIPYGVTRIGDRAFSGTGMQSLDVPSSVQTIQLFSLDGCSDLRTLIIRGEDTQISDLTGCKNLMHLFIYGRDAYIGMEALWSVDTSRTTIHCLRGSFAEDFAFEHEIAIEYMEDPVESFVTRCYSLILGRDPDPDGLAYWTNHLKSGTKMASEIIDGFVNSQEYLGKNYTDAESVEILYMAMLNRGSDTAGKNYWMSALHVGNPFAVIINGFCGSQEFIGLCSEYGIQPGSVQTGETIPFDPNWVAPDITKIQAYVTRCYKVILSRDPDPSGLADWTNQLYSGKRKAAEIIDGFVNSQEFLGKNLSNEDAVEVLYNAMLGRGSDAAGKADWVGKLNEGNPYASVINGFCGSQEFMALCKEYGIEPGSVAVTTLKAASPVPEEAGAEESADVPAEPAAEAEAAAEPETQAPVETEENTAEAVSVEPAAADTEPAPSDPAARSKANGLKQDKVEAFVLRCYRIALNREPGADELNRYVTMIMDGKKSVRQVVQGFIFSDEFKARNLGNEEVIRILYRLFLDREADEEGMAHWLAALNDAGNLGAIVNSFAGSSEFNAAMQKMRR